MKRVSKLYMPDSKNTFALMIIAIIIFIIMAALNPKSFLSLSNIQSMCVQFPEFGIMSFGMMICMISGGIDLSLVGIANLSGILATLIAINSGGGTVSIVSGCLVAIATGALCGIINGFFIGYLQIPAMLVTLCGLQVYKGIGLAITRGSALTGLPPVIGQIANSTILNAPTVFIIFILVALFMSYLLTNTVYGQHLKYMGSNQAAAKYSGIDNLKITIKTYMLSGILSGVSGVIMISRYNSAKADYGTTYTLLTLLIVVLGGTAPEGGKGKVAGVTMSVIVLQLISSAFNIMRVNSYIKTFVWGAVLLIVMIVVIFFEKRKMVVKN